MRNDTKKELLRYREERKEREKHETALKEEIKKCKEHLRRMYEELGNMNKDEGKQVTSEEFEHHETNKGDQQSAEETRTENDEEISTENGRREGRHRKYEEITQHATQEKILTCSIPRPIPYIGHGKKEKS